MYDVMVKLIRIFDNLDKNINNDKGQKVIGNVLVFLPGIIEIEEAFRRLTEARYNS